MTSSKKSKKEENEGRVEKKKIRVTKPTKQTSNKKRSDAKGPKKSEKPNPKSCKTKKDDGHIGKEKNGFVNHTVDDEVVEIASQGSDSQEEDERRERRQKSNNGGIKSPNSNVTTPKKRNRERKDEEIDGVRACKFPISRIRRIIKSEDPGAQISQEAVFLINLATEMFLGKFSKDAHECSIRDRKKFLHYKHLSSVVTNDKRYEFLSDFVPEKLKADAALEAWKSQAG